MLVLTRRTGEEIVITAGAYEILIKVAEIDRNKVVLGFEADNAALIMRREIAGSASPRMPERSSERREQR